MLTITKREQIGSIHDKAIYRVGAFQILPLAENLAGLNEAQVHFTYFTFERVMRLISGAVNRELKNKTLSTSLNPTSKTILFISLMTMI